jgi:DNA-binding beta-propeller fold protein YncE
MQRIWSLLVAATLVVWIGVASGCGGEDGDGAGDGDGSRTGVYVVNEGLFGKGSASLSFYDSAQGRVENFVFKSVNGRPLGDVANDIVVRGRQAWIVVNNSHAIEAIETGTHRSLGRVPFPEGSGPYTLTLDAGGTKGYVPLLLSNGLARVDLTTMSVDSVIEVGANPTEVALAQGKAYVTNSGFGRGTNVTVVDLTTFRVSRIIPAGDQPSAAIAAPNGKIVVLCSGFSDDFNTPGQNESTRGSVVVIDPARDVVVNSVPLDSGASGRMELGPDGLAYLLVEGGVAVFDTNTERLQRTAIQAKAQGVQGFYGLGVDPAGGQVYVTDAKDFVTPGDVYIFEPSGALVTKFTADLIPRAFGFVR